MDAHHLVQVGRRLLLIEAFGSETIGDKENQPVSRWLGLVGGDGGQGRVDQGGLEVDVEDGGQAEKVEHRSH